jgi:hypothetical protein
MLFEEGPSTHWIRQVKLKQAVFRQALLEQPFMIEITAAPGEIIDADNIPTSGQQRRRCI